MKIAAWCTPCLQAFPPRVSLHSPTFLLDHWLHLVDSTIIAVYIGVQERVDTPLPEYLGVVLVKKKKNKNKTKKENQGFCCLALFIWPGRAPPCQASCWGLRNQGDFWTKSDNCSRYSDVWPLAAGHFIPKHAASLFRGSLRLGLCIWSGYSREAGPIGSVSRSRSVERFTIRNWCTSLWRPGSPKTCHQQAGHTGMMYS